MRNLGIWKIKGPYTRETCLQTSALQLSSWVTGQVFLPCGTSWGLPENIPSLDSNNTLAFLPIAGGPFASSKTHLQRSFSVAFDISSVLIYWILCFRLWLSSGSFLHSDVPFYFWLWHKKCEHLWKFRNVIISDVNVNLSWFVCSFTLMVA